MTCIDVHECVCRKNDMNSLGGKPGINPGEAMIPRRLRLLRLSQNVRDYCGPT